MKIGVYIISVIMIVFILIAIGGLIGVNKANNTYSDNFRTLFGGVDKELIINPTGLINQFENTTKISAASGEDGTFQEYKVANKIDGASINVWEQGKSVVSSFFNFSELSLLSKLLLSLITAGLIIGGIEFFRRYKL